MDLSWDHKPKHTFDLKTVILAVLALKKNSTRLHSNQPKLKPVSESLTHSLQNYICFFPTHLQARELCPQTYSLSLPLEWSQVTHTPASIKSGGAYKSEKSAFYTTFARQLCDDTRLPGWLSAFPVHSQTFKPTHASFAHTNSQPSHSMSYKIFLVLFFLSVGGVPPSHMKVPQDHYKGLQATSKGHTVPPLLIPVAAMGKCKQANEFQSRHYGHPTH